MTKRILAVDDDPEVTRALHRLLERHGYEVSEENDSSRALERARALQPHIVILDYMMPNVHGGDVAWQLASDPMFHDVRVILCSGVSQDELHSKLPPTRIPILGKPVDPEALLQLIRDNENAEPEARR
jgi:CheY-like chemotaxis protein